MTKLTWRPETADSFTLRCPKNAPRAHIGRRENDWGFVATIFEPKMPSSGPYKSHVAAAKWVQKIITLRFSDIFPDPEFGDVPKLVRK